MKMNLKMRFAAAVLLAWALGTSAVAADATKAPSTFREIDWLALVPKDWKPQERLDRKKAESLKDGDALAQEMMKELRAVLDSAPTVGAMNGAAIRLPGFIVPLEQSRDGITEFLLVPYHGACIHTPPPPANQIVHVQSKEPIKGFQTMSAVWVTGTLHTVRKDSGMGVSGYALDLAGVEAYRPK
jgi:uncharacterized protein